MPIHHDHSFAFVCRSCFASGYIGAASLIECCPECNSARIIVHEELFFLSIAHIDCDAFYCSVEKRDRPELRERPVIVGAEGRGVVAAACYHARQYGIRSAMPTWQAKKACPELVIIQPRMAHYQAVGKQIRQMMQALSPLVQPLSIDEAFIDLTGTQKLHKDPPAVVLARFQAHVRTELNLTLSIGLSANKSLAKIASDQDKPDGFYLIGADEAEGWLRDKPVNILFGLGKVTSKRLNAAGILTCGQLTQMSEEKLRPLLGRDAHRLAELAKGIDKRKVALESNPRSISSETTFASDLSDFNALAACAEDLCLKVTRQLKAKDYYAKKVVLKLKFFNHRLITRSQMLSSPSQMRHEIFPLICALLKKETGSGQRYRLLGVGVELSDAADSVKTSPTFFDISDQSKIKNSRLEKAVDSVHERMGLKSLRSGRHLRPVHKNRDRKIQKEEE